MLSRLGRIVYSHRAGWPGLCRFAGFNGAVGLSIPHRQPVTAQAIGTAPTFFKRTTQPNPLTPMHTPETLQAIAERIQRAACIIDPERKARILEQAASDLLRHTRGSGLEKLITDSHLEGFKEGCQASLQASADYRKEELSTH